MKRFLISLLMLIAALLLLGPRAAAAQQPDLSLVTQPRAYLDHLPLPGRPEFVAVDVRRIEGPAVVSVGEDAAFTAVANVETATLPLRGRWDFGDGTTAEGLVGAHAYRAPGTYRVTFQLSNERSEDAVNLIVRVVAPPDHP